MNLKTLWTVLSGQDDVPNLVGSLLVYGLAFLICLSLQRSLRVLLPPVLYSYAADFCFTMAICAYPYSHGTVRELHGHLGYVVAAVSVVTLTCLAFEGTASPLGVFQRYLRGMESLWGLALRVLVQILAAFLSYRLVYFIWSMEVTKDHQMLMKRSCESDLRVPVIIGCLIEFSSVLYDTWLSEQQLVRNPLVDAIIKNINAALLVCAGFQMTGMYMHPAMATGMSWNCRGTNTLEHVSVYWLASFTGCFAGVHLDSVFYLPRPTPAVTDKKKRSKASGSGDAQPLKGNRSENNNIKQRNIFNNNNNANQARKSPARKDN